MGTQQPHATEIVLVGGFASRTVAFTRAGDVLMLSAPPQTGSFAGGGAGGIGGER